MLIKQFSMEVLEGVDPANENAPGGEQEKTILLSLSNEIAALRNREDLFEVVNSKVKKLFSIAEFGIAQINADQNTYSAFVLDLEEPTTSDADFNRITTAHYDVTDPLFSKIIHSEEPVLLQVNELASQSGMP